MLYFFHKHHFKHSLITLGMLSLILVTVGGIVLLVVHEKLPPTLDSNPVPSITVTPSPKGEMSFQGRIVCLPHKDPGEVQTLECAYGLVTNNGIYYGIEDSKQDYSTISNAPMNQDINLLGTFIPGESAIYPTIGVIKVISITLQ